MISKLPPWIWTGTWVLAFIAGIVNVVGLLGFEHHAITHLTGNTSLLAEAMAKVGNTDVATLSSLPTGAAVLASRYNAAQLQGELFNRTYSHREGSEKALFGEVSYEFIPTVTATVGGRLFNCLAL